jgi:hypothetical protein
MASRFDGATCSEFKLRKWSCNKFSWYTSIHVYKWFVEDMIGDMKASIWKTMVPE